MGFSLLELLVVFALIVIVACFSIPSLQSMWVRANEQLESEQLLQALHLARNEAISRHHRVIFCGTSDQKSCSSAWTKGYLIKTPNQLIYSFHLISSQGVLHWQSFPWHLRDLKFLPTGLLDADNGTFWYCSSSTSSPAWAVVIGQNGRARLVTPNKNGRIVDSRGRILSCFFLPTVS